MAILTFFKENQNFLFDIVEHIYLNSSIIDIVIRIFCIQLEEEKDGEVFDTIRREIIHNTVNKLEHYQDDLFMTE